MPNATKTRREHLLELLPRLGMEQFGIKHYRAISAWLESTALQTTQGIALVQTAVDELRRRATYECGGRSGFDCLGIPIFLKPASGGFFQKSHSEILLEIFADLPPRLPAQGKRR
jgi:Domain of unknown function (DUF4158)